MQVLYVRTTASLDSGEVYSYVRTHSIATPSAWWQY